MSSRAPENSFQPDDVDKDLSVVRGDPVLLPFASNVIPSNEVHSGLHAIVPGPPDRDGSVETAGQPAMELDFDDEKTDPFIDVATLMAQIEHSESSRPEVVDLEDTQDGLPALEELDEESEIAPPTDSNSDPDPGSSPDDIHTRPTWPKMVSAAEVPEALESVDQGTDAFREALVSALLTDPDGELEVVHGSKIEIVK